MTGSELRLSADAISEVLHQLAARLDARGEHGELFVVGGAAMALAYDSRRTTADVDAVFEPKAVVYSVAKELAAERPELPDDWLNDGVKGFLPGADPGATVLLDIPGLTLRTASAEYLLALKVQASRVARDQDDIRLLAEKVGATTAQDVLAIAERIVGAENLPSRAQYLVEALFEAH